MGYYEELKNRDLVTMMKRLLESGGYFFRDDGRIDAKRKLNWDGPWEHIRHHPMLDCGTWHQILFDVISMQMPAGERFVPSRCQDCYKVVVRPRTLRQLFALRKLQKRLDVPSKCGIEIRETVHGLYGGYFYNIGLDQGKESWAMVRKEVTADPELGPDVPVILKRACTEYELALGPSDKWIVTQRQLELEGILETLMAKDDINRKQTDANIYYVHRKWIEFAYAFGDPTYRDFTEGPLYPDYVTYHQEVTPNVSS